MKVSEHPPSSNGMCFPRLPYGLEAALVLDAQLSLKQDTSHTCSVCIHEVMQHRWQSPYELDLLDALMAERTARHPLSPLQAIGGVAGSTFHLLLPSSGTPLLDAPFDPGNTVSLLPCCVSSVYHRSGPLQRLATPLITCSTPTELVAMSWD